MEKRPHFRRLGQPGPHLGVSLWALLCLWLIIPSGALVRLTGSGLGCSNVPPYCKDGSILPALTGHALIEYTNRLFSGFVMLLTLFAWFTVRRTAGGGSVGKWWLAAALCTVGQIPLGALTVAFDLHPLLVSSHFMLSLVALGLGTVATMRARDRASGMTRGFVNQPQAGLGTVTAFALLVGLVTGILVTAAGPHSGDRLKVRRFGVLGDAAYIHVRAVFTFAFLAVLVAVLVGRRGNLEALGRRLLAPWLVLVAVQIFLGEWQYRHGFPWQMILAHVTIAGLLWTLTVALAMMVASPVTESAPSVSDALTGNAPLGVGADL